MFVIVVEERLMPSITLLAVMNVASLFGGVWSIACIVAVTSCAHRDSGSFDTRPVGFGYGILAGRGALGMMVAIFCCRNFMNISTGGTVLKSRM